MLQSPEGNEEKREIMIRPLPQSQYNIYGKIIGEEKWEFMQHHLNPTELVSLFEFYSAGVTNSVFPQKSIILAPGPFLNTSFANHCHVINFTDNMYECDMCDNSH